MKQKVILVVVRDIGGANVAGPLVRLLRQSSVRVVVIAEDKANDAFVGKFGITPDYDARVDVVDPESTLFTYNPDLVVVGIGSPIKLELEFLRAANKYGIKTVALEDFHGNHHRLAGEQPSLMLVLDSYAVELAERSRAAHALIAVGNGAISAASPSPVARVAFEQLREMHEAVYVFPTGSTFSDAKLAVACMQQTKGCLVALLHPKLVSRDVTEGITKTYGDWWREILAPLGKRAIFLPEVSSEDVVTLADGTISGFSSLMYTAAWHCRKIGALATAEVAASLHAQTGLSRVPIVELGLANVIADADLATLPRLEVVASLFPYDARIAESALLHLLFA